MKNGVREEHGNLKCHREIHNIAGIKLIVFQLMYIIWIQKFQLNLLESIMSKSMFGKELKLNIFGHPTKIIG